MKTRLLTLSLISGMMLVLFTSLLFVLPAAGFLVKLPVSPLLLWISAAGTIAFGWFAARHYDPDRPIPLFLSSLAAAVIPFAVSFAVAGAFFDLSYDGQAYHQEAIIHLANGWNPVYDAPLDLPTAHEKWINHYAKAAEIAAAAFYKATGLIEHGKLINLLLIFASFLLAAPALLTLGAGRLRPAAAVVLAAVVAFNPISVTQAFSYYVDGMLSSSLMIMLALGALLFSGKTRGNRDSGEEGVSDITKERPGWIVPTVFAASLLFAVNLKFTALGYAGVLCIGLLIALYMTERFTTMKRMFVTMAAAGLIAVLAVGYNPYVTNTLSKGHPFYPLAGKDSVDIMENFTPRNLERLNRFEQAAVSYFAVSRENGTDKMPTSTKVPFTVSPKELAVFSEPDVAVGGFGPLFGGILLIAAVALMLAYGLSAGATIAVSGVIAVLLASAFINPAAWWARYVPQVWVIPIACAWLAFVVRARPNPGTLQLRPIRGQTQINPLSKREQLTRVCGWALAGLLAVNATLVAYSYTTKQWNWSEKLRSQYAELAAMDKPLRTDFSFSWSNRVRFENYGIPFREETPLRCDNPLTLIKSGTTVCLSSTVVREEP
ncbi:hypothetical protein [Paenibacillus oceani]|uniref:Uncharacterized protein n=1 Tax=Paenibacillus oceani TaxID=2772510 RepID=A0A927CCW9_9BACL|nr:hypothetical protein [Paenibacillus oceani]MBD2864292.1 hypothetical protein [Paenibacillus oceani]